MMASFNSYIEIWDYDFFNWDEMIRIINATVISTETTERPLKVTW